MTKRKHSEISQTPVTPTGDTTHPADLHDSLLSPAENEAGSVLPTRARPFIASQACDQCRLKKTKCDEDRPRCSTCTRNGLECHYAETKPTKKDQTISKIYSSIYRLERKIEDVATLIRQQNDTPSSSSISPSTNTHQDSTSSTNHHQQQPPLSLPIPLSPDELHHHHHNRIGSTSTVGGGAIRIADVCNPTHHSPELKKAKLFTPLPTSDTPPSSHQMSFSAHKILQWPALQALLPPELRGLEDYATTLEASRPPLPFDTNTRQGDWLNSLSLKVVKGLTEAYFNLFNTSNPILDRGYFYASTLSVAVESSFGYNIQSCIVLEVLALGCLAVTAHKEADFPLFPLQDSDDLANDTDGNGGILGFTPPEWMHLVEEADGLPSGLRFINEMRKRFGFLACGVGLEYIQCHFLAGLYYAQVVRVMDHWNMIHKAAVGCLQMLLQLNVDGINGMGEGDAGAGGEVEQVNWDSWENDMLSRCFWNTLMFESILVQELDVPPSGLTEYEDIVPLPKFPAYNSGTGSTAAGTVVEDDGSNYQYHFLAQATHRKLLNRMRKHIYTYDPTLPNFPSIPLSRELQRQLDLWRSHHPPIILQQSLLLSSPSSPPHPTKLASLMMSAMLNGRYLVGKHLMRRPFVYKALHYPAPLSEPVDPEVLDEVRWCLESALDWPQISGVFERARTAVPIKFEFGSQFMGHLLLLKGVQRSERVEVRGCLPVGWEGWVKKLFGYFREMAGRSPTLARDLYVLEEIYKA